LTPAMRCYAVTGIM